MMGKIASGFEDWNLRLVYIPKRGSAMTPSVEGNIHE